MSAETMKKTKKPFSMKKWVKSRNGQQTIVILSFMIIPLLLLFVFTYLPFGEMVKFSFYKMKYATPVDKRQFVGFRNYIDVFKKDECFSALKLSLYYMAGAMVQLVLALYLATILSFKTKFGNMFKGFMFFPYLISGIAIGFIFKFFYTRGFVFDTVLQWCGFNLESLPFWLKDKSVNNISLVLPRYGVITATTWYSSSVPSCPWTPRCTRQQSWTVPINSNSLYILFYPASRPSLR